MQEGVTPLYSDAVAAQIDKEVSFMIERAQKVAERILRNRRSVLARIARVLVEKETIEREEFDKLIGKKK